MNYFSDSSARNFSHGLAENFQNGHEVEKNAQEALKKINLLYNEIMTPREDVSEESEHLNNDLENEMSLSKNGQNHYLRTCCNSVSELCAKCDRFVSKCSTCNYCNCIKSKSYLRKSSNVSLDEAFETLSVSNYSVKCTVPQPFSFCDKIEEHRKAREMKIDKMKQELEKKIEDEMKIRAHCKPVPKNTHIPLYNKMVQEKEKLKEIRKEKCLEILNNTKPFNLHSSSRNSEQVKSSSNITLKTQNFKAKPVPKHILSNKVSERLKNKEKLRKMLISERAKHTVEQSSSPFSHKNDTHSRSLNDLLNYCKPQTKETKSKNIEEITKRLYVKKCNETMENWNRKVMQVDAKEKMMDKCYQQQCNLINDFIHSPKRHASLTEELPFMYFPVRMSNAAILRENHIRADITAREEREKRKKLEDELSKKKVNSDIAHRLRELIPVSETEKEIDDKVKNFRESQIQRNQDYKKELEEIMKRVSEQNLLLERQSKVKQVSHPQSIYSSKESETDDDEQESEESVTTKSNTDSSTDSR